MHVGAIVQARMTSARLPGKVLRRVAGKPLLQYLLERLERCSELADVVVATTTDASDAAIVSFCDDYGVACRRGPLDDVAARLESVARELAFGGFVRVSADSPLLDQRLVDRAVALFAGGAWDLVTNVFPRTFPAGESVEVLRTAALSAELARMREPSEREHVTPRFYAEPDRFRILNITAERPCPELRLAVDTEDDVAAFASMLAQMDRPHWDYDLDEIVALRAGVPA